MPKLYYSISEVSKLLNEEQHILRYWEKEFKSLKPKKNSAGNRKYSLKDLETLKQIKHLVRDKELNLINARDIVDNKKTDIVESAKPSQQKTLMINIDKNILIDTINTLKELSKKLKQM